MSRDSEKHRMRKKALERWRQHYLMEHENINLAQEKELVNIFVAGFNMGWNSHKKDRFLDAGQG
jgi:hypothetical protein